jgi:hypothetical protein
MNNPKLKLLVILLIPLIALGVGAWRLWDTRIADEGASAQNTTTGRQVDEEPAQKTGRTEITYVALPGMTSLAQLQLEADDVVVTESEYGKLVDSIEGHKGGNGGKYWSFYINGEMAPIGADAYIQQEGDTVLWKFQKL